MHFCFGISWINSTTEFVFTFASIEDIDVIHISRIATRCGKQRKEEILKEELKASTLITTHSNLLGCPISHMEKCTPS